MSKHIAFLCLFNIRTILQALHFFPSSAALLFVRLLTLLSHMLWSFSCPNNLVQVLLKFLHIDKICCCCSCYCRRCFFWWAGSAGSADAAGGASTLLVVMVVMVKNAASLCLLLLRRPSHRLPFAAASPPPSPPFSPFRLPSLLALLLL